MKTFKNLIDIMDFFETEEFCHNFLKDTFWGKNRENKSCPSCGSSHIHEFKDFKKNRCYDCKFEFSIRKNTIFDDSKISLKKWFMVIFLANSNKKGVNSHAVARQVGITQKSSWFMLQRIKNASVVAMFDNQFEGTVEIDEAYLGGSETNRHAKDKKLTGEKDKTVVIGMVNRETKQVKSMKIPTNEKDFLLPKINLNVKQGSTIITDTYQAYKDLKKNYTHKTVKHSAGEYCRVESKTAFKIHTNSIEGFWSLVKRTINGTHHWISKKHTNRYLAEMSFRYNTKASGDNERFMNFLQMTFTKFTYKELIA
jgi:transposase-like protein